MLKRRNARSNPSLQPTCYGWLASLRRRLSSNVRPQFRKGSSVTPPTIGCARLVRDGGIDAMAALNEALREAVVGLAPQEQQALQRAFGQVMGEVVEKIINPAVQAFPELEPAEDTWATVARARAALRSNAA
jgi:hypothetical protein